VLPSTADEVSADRHSLLPPATAT